jgi:hypothetical protein
MYSLDCSYFKAEFETLEELIESVIINGMDPSYEVTFNGEGTGEQIFDLIDLIWLPKI